jgi:DNA recombination protein RmuC
MAEDVLRLAGMIEGVNYRKQSTTESGTKPDFVFLLPTGPRVNMDVKFPIANYLRFLESDDADADRLRKTFLTDVRSRVKEVTTRDYIDPVAGTLDFVLVFIPNEQLYGFIHENDPQLIEFALSRKVVLCSPLTLFAILAVIRQAADNFRLQQASNEILRLLGEFNKQWAKYGEVVERLGRQLESAMKAYTDLTTTRTRQLERQLDKIEALRSEEAPVLPAQN